MDIACDNLCLSALRGGIFMKDVMVKDDIKIEDLIYEIRGKYVMLDSDLAILYGCKNGTKEVNQAVRNNPSKFPERFSWRLTDEDKKSFLVKNFDQKIETRGGRYRRPRVFTEQGVAMLATILKTKVATEVSIRIMDAFVAMRHYISSNLIEQKYINNMVLEDNERINKNTVDIKLLQESFDKLETAKEINHVYFNGKVYDAYSKVLDIFGEAKDKLIVVDRYTDKTFLDMIRNIECNVILITGKRSNLTKLDIDKYNQDYNNLTVYYDDTFHDRYFVIDNNKVYHSGNSINHIGYRKSGIDVIHDKNVCATVINDIEKIIGGKL